MAHINLLPWRENLRKERKRKFGLQLLGGAVLAGAAALYWHMMVQQKIEHQNSRNALLKAEIVQVDKKIVEIKDIEKRRAQLISRMEIIQDLQVSRPQIVHLFDELVESIPEGAYLVNLDQKGNKVTLTIINKMGHKIITQPMRLKFVKTVISRDGKVIWSNFDKTPVEDKEATFIIVFKDSEGKPSLPGKAVGYRLNQNLEAMTSKEVTYAIDDLKKGDKVTSTWISYIISPKVAEKLQITDEELIKPIKGYSVELDVE